MSLLPYHKGNKTKFTNLLFPLIHKRSAPSLLSVQKKRTGRKAGTLVIFRGGYFEVMIFRIR